MIGDIQKQVQDMPEQAVGKLAVAIAGGGTLIQVLTDWASLALVVLNIVLACGGLYLAYHKILDRRRNRRASDPKG